MSSVTDPPPLPPEFLLLPPLEFPPEPLPEPPEEEVTVTLHTADFPLVDETVIVQFPLF